MSVSLRTIQDIIRERMNQRYPMDERLPSGIPAVQVGIPETQRQALGLSSASNAETPRSLSASIPFNPSAAPPPTPGAPTTMEEIGSPPPPPIDLSDPGAGRMRASYDPRTGEPHREFYERGVNPLQEKIAYRDALQQWRPRGHRGLRDILKSVGISALLGMQATPDNPLAGAAGGAVAGLGGHLIKPSFGGTLSRNLKLQRENTAIDQGINTDYRQAQTERVRVASQEAQADLIPDPDRPGRMIKRPPTQAPRYVERGAGVFEISAAHPDGRRLGNIPSEVKASKRGPIHWENREEGLFGVYEDADGSVKWFKVEGVPGKPPSDAQGAAAAEGEALAGSTEEASRQLRVDLDRDRGQLLENERAVKEKERVLRQRVQELLKTPELKVGAFRTYDQARKQAEDRARAEDPDVQSGVYDETVRNSQALSDAIKEREKRLADMEEDIRKARAKGARGTKRASPATQSSGRKWSASKWAADPANKGGDVEAAKAAAKAAGYQVVK